MTDIARLGYSVDTSQLVKGRAELEKMVPAAKQVATANAAVTVSFGNVNTAVTRAAQGLNSGKTAMQSAAAGGNMFRTMLDSVATTAGRFTGAIGALISRLGGVAPAAAGATSSLNRMGAAANDNINRMQATPGNIAAQFQDIGVTAAMGMNPMLIALQQGTQLSAAMSGGIGNLMKGLTQLFSVTALMTIGLVGLIAAFIQWVDWMKVAQGALEFLADVMVPIAPYAVAIAAALVLIYSPAIIAGIFALTKAFIGLTLSMLGALGIPALIVLGFAAIVAAANIWRDELTQMLGFDIVAAAKTGVNYIIAFFVGGYNAIAATWKQLPGAIGDWAIQAANAVIAAIEGMVSEALNRMSPLLTLARGLGFKVGFDLTGSFGRLDNPFAGQGNAVGSRWGQETRDAAQVDYVGAGVEMVTNAASSAADMLRRLASGLGGAETDADKAAKGRTPRTKQGDKPDGAYTDLMQDANKQLRALRDVSAQIGVYGEALTRLEYEQQLFNKAQDTGVKLTEALTEELKRRAAEMASLAQDNARSQLLEDFRRDHEDQMWMLERERNEIGLMNEALEAQRIQTDLLRQAREQNIALNKMDIEALQRYATEQAHVIETIRRAREALEFARDTTRSFFEEWYKGILNGKGMIESFADAVVNSLNRVIEKLMDRYIDKLLDVFLGGNTGVSFIDSFIGSLMGGIGKSAGTGGTGIPKGFAMGGVVDRPTLFTFANGGAIGQMGEAGAEGILPLKRGADGALGVQGHGMGGNVTNVQIDVKNDYTLSGALTSTDIVGLVKSASAQTQSEIKQQLAAWLGELQRDGATVG